MVDATFKMPPLPRATIPGSTAQVRRTKAFTLTATKSLSRAASAFDSVP